MATLKLFTFLEPSMMSNLVVAFNAKSSSLRRKQSKESNFGVNLTRHLRKIKREMLERTSWIQDSLKTVLGVYCT